MIYIDLEEISGRNDLILCLSFPKRNIEYASRIFEDLMRIGVESLVFIEASGGIEPFMLGKGYRGFVLKGRLGGRDAALKILRTDSTTSSLKREAEATSLANSVGVGPNLLGFTDTVLALEFIEGAPLEVWLSSLEENRLDELRAVLMMCFEDARKLDEIRLDHGELSDVKKHVILKPNLKPVIIDFGKASNARRPSNVTALFNYFFFGPHSQKIRKMLSIEKLPLDEARDYKKRLSGDTFHRLMESLNLLKG